MNYADYLDYLDIVIDELDPISSMYALFKEENLSADQQLRFFEFLTMRMTEKRLDESENEDKEFVVKIRTVE